MDGAGRPVPVTPHPGAPMTTEAPTPIEPATTALLLMDYLG
jgi:hypothetical protein